MESKLEAPANLAIGQEVLVHGKFSGIVRWKGPTQFKPGEWIGVELLRPVGKNNGCVKGVTYFKCKANRGLFVRPHACEPYTKEGAAAATIQSASRMHLAKKKVKAERNARTWNMLDNHIEELNVRSGKAISDASRSLGKAANGKVRVAAGELDGIGVSSDYEGAHLTWPLTLDIVLEMLEHFKLGHSLHYKYTMQLLTKFKKVAAAVPTLEALSIPEGVKLTVCGDTHGQLQDVFTIFTINGLPSPTNQYLFNGDFVDRGGYGAEIFLCLIAFKLLYPDAMFINRGNHEARAQNSWMGFEDEIFAKYDGSSEDDPLRARRVYELFETVFDTLPLCSIVAEKVFVCHGGLFRLDGVTLNHINSIKRKREPPLEGRTLEDKMFEDILWSDPRPTQTYPRPLQGRRPSDRGAGIEFGPDVTQRFCADNAVALIIRSHECVQEGYEVLHNGRLITIFSASRYCGTQTNKGAFITFGHDLQPEIQQFFAHSMEANEFKQQQQSQAAREVALEEDAVRMIIERICDKKADLFWYYTQEDKSHTGSVSRLAWAQGLTSVLGLELHYLYYQSQLCDLDSNGNVNYAKFLERYRIEMRPEDSAWQAAVLRRVCQKLYEAANSVEDAFSVFDTNSDGSIEYEEFMSTLKELDLGLTDLQIYELMRSIDVDQDSHIDAREFGKRFQVEFDKLASQNGEGGNWTQAALQQVGLAIYSNKLSMPAAFAKFDKSGSGYLDTEEFQGVLRELQLEFNSEQAAELFAIVDANGSGRINYVEFVSAFKVTDSATEDGVHDWQDGVVQQVANVFYQHRIQLKSAFRMFDLDNDGKISDDEFRMGLAAINTLIDSPLSPIQIDELRRALDRNSDGEIDYREFLEGFHLVDMNATDGAKDNVEVLLAPDTPGTPVTPTAADIAAAAARKERAFDRAAAAETKQ